MKQLSLFLGIIAIIGMIVGFIPCLGWVNWLNIPIAAVGLILGAIDYNKERSLTMTDPYDTNTRPIGTPIGLILCGIAVVLGTLRLFVGGGII